MLLLAVLKGPGCSIVTLKINWMFSGGGRSFITGTSRVLVAFPNSNTFLSFECQSWNSSKAFEQLPPVPHLGMKYHGRFKRDPNAIGQHP